MKYCAFDEKGLRPCDMMAIDCDGCEFLETEIKDDNIEINKRNEIINFLLGELEYKKPGSKEKALEIILDTWGDEL